MLLHDHLLTNPNLDFKFIESLTRSVRNTYPTDSFVVNDPMPINPYMQKNKLIGLFSINLNKLPRLQKASPNELYILYKLYSAIEKVFWKDLYKFQSDERSYGFSALNWFCGHKSFLQIRNIVEADYYQKDTEQKITKWHKPSVIDIVASPSSAFAQALLSTVALTNKEQIELIRNIYTKHYCDKEKYLFESSNRATVFWDAYLNYATKNLTPTHKETIISVLSESLSKLHNPLESNFKKDLRITTLNDLLQKLAITQESANDVRFDGLAMRINDSSSYLDITAWVNNTLPKIKARYIGQLWKDGKISDHLIKRLILSIFELNSVDGLKMLQKFNEVSEFSLELKKMIHWGIWTSSDNGSSFKYECCDLLKITQNEFYNWSKEEAFDAFNKIHDEPGAIQLVMECHNLDADDLQCMMEQLLARLETLKLGGIEPSKGDRAIQGSIAKLVDKYAVDFIYNGNYIKNVSATEIARFLLRAISSDKITPDDLHQIQPALLLDAIKSGGEELDKLIKTKHEIQEVVVAIALAEKLSSLDVTTVNAKRLAL